MHNIWRSRVFLSANKTLKLWKCIDGRVTSARVNFAHSSLTITRPSSSFREKKRFYNKVGIEEAEGGYQITVDNKKVKTPAGKALIVPSRPLAMAVAVEWNSQRETIKPENMHLTSLSNTVIDNPKTRTRGEQISHILEFLSSDTICFYANEPEELVNLQRNEWQPLIDWFDMKYDVSVEPSNGLFVSVPHDAIQKLQSHLSSLNTWSLTGIEFAVETLKSIILSMALVDNHLTVERAVALSRLELEFQISRWGSVEWAHDLELMETRSRVAAAALFYSLNSGALSSISA
ncbi:ATP synthase mitochondrial F1 complex assembly factor 2-like [Montipora capricornis]|uniref:ATP synthase mitochondrial F1 complex assembly factor 2-like n=1 Tax=Montipora capricornis TaxID=246305 RepID=UPI0035F14A5F